MEIDPSEIAFVRTHKRKSPMGKSLHGNRATKIVPEEISRWKIARGGANENEIAPSESREGKNRAREVAVGREKLPPRYSKCSRSTLR